MNPCFRENEASSALGVTWNRHGCQSPSWGRRTGGARGLKLTPLGEKAGVLEAQI